MAIRPYRVVSPFGDRNGGCLLAVNPDNFAHGTDVPVKQHLYQLAGRIPGPFDRRIVDQRSHLTPGPYPDENVYERIESVREEDVRQICHSPSYLFDRSFCAFHRDSCLGETCARQLVDI